MKIYLIQYSNVAEIFSYSPYFKHFTYCNTDIILLKVSLKLRLQKYEKISVKQDNRYMYLKLGSITFKRISLDTN